MNYAGVLDFQVPDLFIPVMYTESDMSIVVHVHANAIINICN